MKKSKKQNQPQSSIGKYFAELKKEESAKNNNGTTKEQKPTKKKTKTTK